ncbi:hypothetical protein ACFL6C_07645 [Myxococcota bacterium]
METDDPKNETVDQRQIEDVRARQPRANTVTFVLVELGHKRHAPTPEVTVKYWYAPILLVWVGCAPEPPPPMQPHSPTCASGGSRCAGDSLQRCDAGRWVEIQDCDESGVTCVSGSDGVAVCAEPSPPDCLDGAQTCEQEVLQQCQEGAWVESEDCSSDSKTCVRLSENSAACLEECVAGSGRCGSDNDVQQCVAGEWLTVDQCTINDQLCVPSSFAAAECRRDCVDGSRRCNDNIVEVCEYIWVQEQTCGIDELCVQTGDDAECRVRQCEDGKQRCNGDSIEVCELAEWELQTECDASAGLMCWTDGVSEPECRVRECSGSEQRCHEGGEAQDCVGGLWHTSQICGDAEICIERSDTLAECLVPCQPGVIRCADHAVEACDGDGVWQTSQACEDACVEVECNQAANCLGGAGCVDACDSDSDCVNGSCLPFYGACQPSFTSGLCEPCSTDTQCGLFGDACMTVYDGEVYAESVCGIACGTDEDCPRGFACDSGQCAPRDGTFNIHTCSSIADLLEQKSCLPGAGSCGIPEVDDGTCYLGTCTVGCSSDSDCPEGTHCHEYAGPNFCAVDSI